MTRPDEEGVRERFEQERFLRDKSNERSKRRLRALYKIVVWLVAVFFLAMTLGALYWEYPMVLELFEGHRDGWVPTNFLVVLLVLVAGLLFCAAALVVSAWMSSRSNDR